MLSITSVDALHEAVEYHSQFDEFFFDVETLPQDPSRDTDRGDWQRNRVVWLSIATPGRCDIIPLGHPNGDFVRLEFPLTPTGEKRVAEGKAPLKSSYSTDVRKATKIWTPPPPQLSWYEARPVLEPLFMSDRLKIAQNAKFDLKSIAKHFGGQVPKPPYACTAIAGFLLDSRNKGRLDLASAVEREVGYTLKKGVGRRIEDHSFAEVERYGWIDSKYGLLLWHPLKERLLADIPGLWRLEQDVLEAVVAMEVTGAPIAVKRLQELDDYLRARLEDTNADIWRLVGRPFNIDSRAELSEALFKPKKDGGTVGLRPKKLTDGGQKVKDAGGTLEFKHYSTDEKALALHEGNPVIDKLIEYGDLKKLHGGFVVPYLGGEVIKTTNGKSKTEYRESLLVNGRIHATFKQDGAETGRFSSKDPNLQQVPSRSEDGKKVRGLFSVEEMVDQGLVLVQADYSQIEPRILTDISLEPALMKVYLEGGDVYTALAAPFGLDRDAGKVMFLSVAYGTGPDKLAVTVGIPLADAKDIIYEQFPKAFPKIETAKKMVIRDAKRRKPAHVRTILGRRRYLPELFSSDNSYRRRAERQAFNTYIQGSAADINKVGLVRCHRMITPLGGQIIATVHDEILALAPRENVEEIAALVQESMEGVNLLKNVPLIAKTKIVTNWADAK